MISVLSCQPCLVYYSLRLLYKRLTAFVLESFHVGDGRQCRLKIPSSVSGMLSPLIEVPDGEDGSVVPDAPDLEKRGGELEDDNHVKA